MVVVLEADFPAVDLLVVASNRVVLVVVEASSHAVDRHVVEASNPAVDFHEEAVVVATSRLLYAHNKNQVFHSRHLLYLTISFLNNDRTLICFILISIVLVRVWISRENGLQVGIFL